MVFVHARNATVRTAMALREKAKNNGHICHFLSPRGSEYGQAEKQVSEYFALIVFSVWNWDSPHGNRCSIFELLGRFCFETSCEVAELNGGTEGVMVKEEQSPVTFSLLS